MAWRLKARAKPLAGLVRRKEPSKDPVIPDLLTNNDNSSVLSNSDIKNNSVLENIKETDTPISSSNDNENISRHHDPPSQIHSQKCDIDYLGLSSEPKKSVTDESSCKKRDNSNANPNNFDKNSLTTGCEINSNVDESNIIENVSLQPNPVKIPSNCNISNPVEELKLPDKTSSNITEEKKGEKTDRGAKAPVSNILSKYSKKFKPVLNSVIRKKEPNSIEIKDSETNNCIQQTNKNSNESLKKDQKILNSIDNSSGFEKENVDKNIRLEEESILTSKNESTVSPEKPSPAISTQEQVQTNHVNETSTAESQVDRSPVKFLQPKKRQMTPGFFSNMSAKAIKEYKERFKNGNVDKSKILMRDLIFYNPKTNPMPEMFNVKTKKDHPKNKAKQNSPDDLKLEEERVDDVGEDDDVSNESSMPIPQVKLGPDGKIIIDPKSLVIEGTGIQKERENLQRSEIIEEDEFSRTKFTKKRISRVEWSNDETLLFYKALNDLGADFSLMQSLFPKKTRKDLKMKFKKEERLNSHLIDKAMKSSMDFDFSALEIELKKDRDEKEKQLHEQKRLKQEMKLKRKLEKQLEEQKLIEQRQLREEMKLKRLENKIIVKKRIKGEIKRKDIVNVEAKSTKKPKKRKRNEDSNSNEGADNNFSSDESTFSELVYDENGCSSDVTFRILKRTRYGRQPKIKSFNFEQFPPKQVSRLKSKSKEDTTIDALSDDNSEQSFVLRLNINKTVVEYDSDETVSSSIKETSYQNLKEPLNLSICSINDADINTENVDGELEITNSTIISNDSCSLKIGENSEVFNNKKQFESADYMEISNSESNETVSSQNISIVDEREEYCIIGSDNNVLIKAPENGKRDSALTVDSNSFQNAIFNENTPILLNYLTPPAVSENGNQIIQVLPCNKISLIEEQSDTSESISELQILMHPSSDHTYTSLKPICNVPKKAVILMSSFSPENIINISENDLVLSNNGEGPS